MSDAHSLKLLSGVLGDAAVHHDPADKRTFDLEKLTDRVLSNREATRALVGETLRKADIVALLLQLVAQALSKKLEKPAPAQPPVVAAPGGAGPAPAPLPVLYPTDLRIDLDLVDANNDPIPFTVTDKGDHYAVELLGGTTNVPLRSKATLRAGYCIDGKPFRFEGQTPPALHLYHTARWIAREVGGHRVSTLEAVGKVYRQTDGAGGRIVNWNNEAEEPREATRTGGMDVPMKFPPDADEAVVEVTLEVDTPNGTVRHDKPVRFPKAS